MCLNTLKFPFLFFLFFFLSFFTFNLKLTALNYCHLQDQIVQTLGSLVYYTNELTKELKIQSELNQNSQEFDNCLFFSEEEVIALWNRAGMAWDDLSHEFLFYQQQALTFREAYQCYNQAKEYLASQQTEKAQVEINQALEKLFQLWKQSGKHALIPSKNLLTVTSLRKQKENDLNDIISLPSKVKKKMDPYVISSSHPMKNRLDAIFKQNRVTLNEQTLETAGFKIIAARPRSHIRVLKHPLLPNYLIKANLDSDRHKKRGKSSWEWLVKRCEGAKKIREIIQLRKMKYFVVADKWIYPLPDYPMPPKSSSYTRHLAVLLVTDMHLRSSKENLDAWYYKITEEHLNELYTIISYAQGSSYRPDNISYTFNGQFAFIDTEYPDHGPDYKSIRHYLRPSMREYWDHLIKKGGN